MREALSMCPDSDDFRRIVCPSSIRICGPHNCSLTSETQKTAKYDKENEKNVKMWRRGQILPPTSPVGSDAMALKKCKEEKCI